MRIVVLGGTRFVGRAIVEELIAAGHVPLLVHRGRHPSGRPGVDELLVDRRALPTVREQIFRFRPDAVLDVSAMTADDATTAVSVFGDLKALVISSIDVYRAFESVWAGTVTDAVPLDEEAPLRTGASPDADYVPAGYDHQPGAYDKLEVESAWLDAGATVCRLPMVYGEFDYKRREDFILRRVRAGRDRIPFGAGGFLWSRGHAGELARGVRLAIESDASAGEVFNLAERRCASIRLWAEEIVAAAGHEAELVRVGDGDLPEDLRLTGDIPQHWLVDSGKAERLLGWTHADWRGCVDRSVRWHLGHAAGEPAPDLREDDRALAVATG